jgi:hypothetical protein
MTVFPSQINEVMSVYNRISKVKPATILERNLGGPRDTVHISDEAIKRQILDQAKPEVREQKPTTK